MAKREESVLGLAPLIPAPSLSTNGGLIPWSPSRSLTRDEQRVIEEWRTQTLVIDATAGKTTFGMSKIAEIHQHGAPLFNDTVGTIMSIKEESRGKEYQAYIDEFSTRQIQLAAKHFLGAIEVGATGIGLEIHRSLYPPPEERSFWERLFG